MLQLDSIDNPSEDLDPNDIDLSLNVPVFRTAFETQVTEYNLMSSHKLSQTYEDDNSPIQMRRRSNTIEDFVKDGRPKSSLIGEHYFNSLWYF